MKQIQHYLQYSIHTVPGKRLVTDYINNKYYYVKSISHVTIHCCANVTGLSYRYHVSINIYFIIYVVNRVESFGGPPRARLLMGPQTKFQLQFYTRKNIFKFSRNPTNKPKGLTYLKNVLNNCFHT